MVKASTTDRAILTVNRRTIEGTLATRRERREGVIPAVVYGKSIKPFPVIVPHKPFIQLIHTKGGEHALITLKVEDATNGSTEISEKKSGKSAKVTKGPSGKWEKPVLVKALQYHPVDGRILHIDFHAITLTEKIHVKVPVVLKGEAIGVKEQGGILEHFLREIEMECLPTDILEELVHDVSEMKVGDTVHVRDLIGDLATSDDTKIITDLDSAIASVQEPRKQEEEEVAEGAAEPEVIGEKKEEGGTGAKDSADKTEASDSKPKDA